MSKKQISTEELEQLTNNLDKVGLKPVDLPKGVKPDGKEWNPQELPSGGVGQEVLTYKGVVYKVGQVVYTNTNIDLGSKKGVLIPQRSLGVVIGPALQDEEFWISERDQEVMVHLAFSKSISNNIHCSTISLWGNASPNNVTSSSSRGNSFNPLIEQKESRDDNITTAADRDEMYRRWQEQEAEERRFGNITTAADRDEMYRRWQEQQKDNQFDANWPEAEWGGRIKRFNQIRTKKSKKRANKKSIRLMKKNRKVKRSINKFSKNLSGGSPAVWKDLLKLSVLPSIPKTGGRKKSSKVYKPLGYKKANKLMKNIKKSIKKIRV
jgi:hypothetical protein